MNPIAAGVAVLALIASFFSLTSDWMSKNIKPGSWEKESAAAWDSARNLRPCVGAHDPACKYHDADKVAR